MFLFFKTFQTVDFATNTQNNVQNFIKGIIIRNVIDIIRLTKKQSLAGIDICYWVNYKLFVDYLLLTFIYFSFSFLLFCFAFRYVAFHCNALRCDTLCWSALYYGIWQWIFFVLQKSTFMCSKWTVRQFIFKNL